MKEFSWGLIPVKVGVTANPVAGAEYTPITVPAGKKWLFLGFAGQLVTQAGGGNRYPRLRIAPDGTNVVGVFVGAAVVGGVTQPVYWVQGAITAAVAGFTEIINIPSDGIELPAGGVISSNTVSLTAADDWGVGYYFYKEAPA